MGPTYKSYVNLQSDAETKVHGVLETQAEAGTDADPAEASVALIGRLFTPSRYLCHGSSRSRPASATRHSGPITNAAGFSTVGFLRRVTTIAYRTRELQIARPESGIGSAERSLWQGRMTDTGTAQAG